MRANAATITAHLFCTVIDNYGDLGVCWRLARHLADEHGVAVTLLVDDLQRFQQLAPALDPLQAEQALGRLTVRHWSNDALWPEPADLVIEAFACTLPAPYVQAMQARSTPSVWINLEYLSAEAWVEGCHGLDSVHPQTGLRKTFWFPGFSTRTGGLLRSRQESTMLHEASLLPRTVRQVTLFSYEQPGIAGLLDALALDARPTRLQVFAGRALPDVARWLGRALAVGDTAQRGALSLHVLPLLPHADYDHLLVQSDLNLVRGEDSFVRAQWAGEAMLWHIYPQDDAAHEVKLTAWQQRLESVAADAGTPMPASWGHMLACWNGIGAVASPAEWLAFLADLPAIRQASLAWREHLLAQPDLATQLMRFYADRVESRPK